MKTIFVGPLGGGNMPINGASVKNFHIVNKLLEYIPNLITIDTENWKSDLKVLIKLFKTIILNKKVKYILSLNSNSANKIIRLISLLSPNSEIIYWVIGGSLGTNITSGRYKASDYKHIRNIIVEGQTMKNQLTSAGLNKVSVLPNFKNLPKINLQQKVNNRLKKFVFLSRIIPQKGCDLILETSKILNDKGLQNKFTIDFYGPIENSYKPEFNKLVDELPNVFYKGFLDLRNVENYNILSQYDAMLFPTYWLGEGCPGIVIDAYIAGLPILASDWNLNKDYIINDITGQIFQSKSLNALVEIIEKCITNSINLKKLSDNCVQEKDKYNIDIVLSKENLIKNQIIS